MMPDVNPLDFLVSGSEKIQNMARKFPGAVLLVQVELDGDHKLSSFEVFVFGETMQENLRAEFGKDRYEVLTTMLQVVQDMNIPDNFQAVYRVACPHHESCGIMSFSHDNGINAKGSRVLN